MLMGAQILTDETKEEMQQAGVNLVSLTSQAQHGGWPKGRSSWYHLPESFIHQSSEGMGGGTVLLIKAARTNCNCMYESIMLHHILARGSLLAVLYWSAAAFAPTEAWKTYATGVKKKLDRCG